MRNETQVLEQILQFARSQEDIRAVVMNGSRVNPNAPKDLMCDYDVVCYTRDPRCFLQDQSWIAGFGELIILQQNDYANHGLDGCIFLMLFRDGVRIDLSFDPLESLAYLGEDSLTHVLLDKDGCLPALPPASDRGYNILPPSRKLFDETVNDALWCAGNVAKGLWRGELAYAHYMLDEVVRPRLLHLLEWYAAMQHDWSISTGAYGNWLQTFLPPDLWADYASTYAGVQDEDLWRALFQAVQLVQRTGSPLAQHLGYEYPHEDHRRVLAHLQRVQVLPRSAQTYTDLQEHQA
jgi:aminoglycoside 6-adenylyltransferase